MVLAENTPDILTLPPNHFAILTTNNAPQLLKQCSRDTPQADSFWMPEQTQIIQLEGKLVNFINQRKEKSFSTPIFQAYDRQYIGIIQNGNKFIYGHYFPSQYSPKVIPSLTKYLIFSIVLAMYGVSFMIQIPKNFHN